MGAERSGEARGFGGYKRIEFAVMEASKAARPTQVFINSRIALLTISCRETCEKFFLTYLLFRFTVESNNVAQSFDGLLRDNCVGKRGCGCEILLGGVVEQWAISIFRGEAH